MGAVRQDVGNILVEERRLFEPPIYLQNEIAVLSLTPKRFVTRGFALGIVIDNPIDDLPVSVIAGGNFPPIQVFTIEKRDKSLRCGIVGRPGREANQQR
jgi:hypothetical protein